MSLTTQLTIPTDGRGLYSITQQVMEALGKDLPKNGLVNCFITHTSASLTIQENADPSAKKDLESFLNRVAPDDQSWHEHTAEGPDDSSSHMKAAITSTSLNIPIREGRLALGTWQGLFLWEHRFGVHRRNIHLTVLPV